MFSVSPLDIITLLSAELSGAPRKEKWRGAVQETCWVSPEQGPPVCWSCYGVHSSPGVSYISCTAQKQHAGCTDTTQRELRSPVCISSREGRCCCMLYSSRVLALEARAMSLVLCCNCVWQEGCDQTQQSLQSCPRGPLLLQLGAQLHLCLVLAHHSTQ